MELRVVHQPERRSKKRRKKWEQEESKRGGQYRGRARERGGINVQIMEDYMPDLYCKTW